MPHSTCDIAILGAGIAGLSLADAFQEQGLEVCVIDKSSIAAGASGTPGGLVNPATGRRATKTWKAEQCYKAIKENLEKAAPFAKQPFYKQNGILRPALLQKMARKMRDQFENTTWPEGWCRWISEDEIKKWQPGIQCVSGGLWLPIGITVDVGEYLKALAHYLEHQGVSLFTNVAPQIADDKNSWSVSFGDQKITSTHLVYATGYETTKNSYWKDLPIHPVKGQLGLFEAPKALLNFDYSIASLGYIARLGDSNRFIQGSTYDHNFTDIKPNETGLEYLRGRMKRTLPELEENATLIKLWAGVRASTPNYKPILGEHPEHKNLHVFTGLGSKGLMYGKFLANHYAEHLLGGTELFNSISIKRV